MGRASRKGTKQLTLSARRKKPGRRRLSLAMREKLRLRKLLAPVKRSVLFVCQSNISRSPMAEAIFRHLINQRGVAHNWNVDSGGLALWNIRQPPDPRVTKVLEKKGIEYKHVAKLVVREDFLKYEYVLGMDHDNITELTKRANLVPTSESKIDLLGNYDPQKSVIIFDPFYGDETGFYNCYEQCLRSCQGFLDSLEFSSSP